MSPIRMSKIESSTRAVLAYKDAFNRHDVDVIIALLSEDCVLEPVENGVRIEGIEAIKTYLEAMFRGNEQAQMEIESVFGMGLHVVMRWHMSGDKSLRYVDIFKFKGALISEKLTYRKE